MKIIALSLSLATAIPGCALAQTAATRSFFEPGACAVDVASHEKIACGVLHAPENRSVPDSQMIQLPVIIFRSRATHPASDPVMFLTGGPGNSALIGQRSGRSNPFEDADRVRAQTSSDKGLGGMDARTASPEMCAAWNVATAPAVANEPVRTDIPTLVFAGEFDPSTPPQWGRQLLANMPGAFFVQMPGLSHGASFNPCGGRMALDFINDPTKPPLLTCVAKLPGADFSASAASLD